MTFPYDQTTDLPLTTDDQVLARVADLIGRAERRQWWTLALDAADRQLPVVMPMAGYPADPNELVGPGFAFGGTAAELLADRLSDIAEEIEAASLVFVWERPGAAEATAEDRAWARTLGEECRALGLRVRAQLIAHDGGVRWFAPDDYA